MRILIHSNSPWTPAGYGQQTAQITPRLASLGHEVAISAFCGINASQTVWNGHLVYPAGIEPYGGDVLPGHAADWHADLVLTVMDAWVLGSAPLKALDGPRVACWMPVDCTPLSLMDADVLRECGATPIAMSEFGRRELLNAGFLPLHAPHGIDTQVFVPGDKQAAREAAGLPPEAYVIGMNATNIDAVRKGFPEQFTAFAMFRAAHPDAVLLIHTQHSGYGAALDLRELAGRLGIADAICWTDSYRYAVGAYSQGDMALWYACLDLYSACSYGEGFGLPLLEAQSCGIPVAATDFSAMTEIAGPHGFLVQGEPFWNARHRAFWSKPRVSEIAAVYEKAYATPPDPDALREHALGYDADRVLASHWKTVMDHLAGPGVFG